MHCVLYCREKGPCLRPLVLSEGVTEVGVDGVIHVVFTKGGFHKLQTKAHVVLYLCVHTDIEQHPAVLLSFNPFLSGRITKYGLAVIQQVELPAGAGPGRHAPVLTTECFTQLNPRSANQRAEILVLHTQVHLTVFPAECFPGHCAVNQFGLRLNKSVFRQVITVTRLRSGIPGVGSVVLRTQTGKVACVVIVMVNIFTNQIDIGTGVKQC